MADRTFSQRRGWKPGSFARVCPAWKKQPGPTLAPDDAVQNCYVLSLVGESWCLAAIRGIRELTEHKVGDIGAGDPGGNGFIGRRKTCFVASRTRTVGERRRTNDNPIDVAAFNDLLLHFLIREDAVQQDRDKEIRVEGAELAFAVADAER